MSDPTPAAGPVNWPVELRSDTFTLPTPEMLRAMSTAELGDDVYGEDPTVRALEELSAELLGKRAACFMPTGTMANLASILTHCPRGSKVVVGEDSDIYVYEAGGASVCGGVVYHPVPNRPDGTMDLAAIEAAFPPDESDPQFALPALICVENPQNHSGSHVLPMSYLAAVAELAREKGLPVHLDGARVFNAALAIGVDPAEIAGHADSVQFCLSKGLGAPAGSMVVGTETFVGGVRRIRKLLGGGMRQSGVLAAAGIVALRERDRLREDHATARRLAEGLAAIPGIEVEPAEPRTNMVFFHAEGLANRELLAAAAAGGVAIAELGTRIRAVTHRGVSIADVDYTVEVIRRACAEGSGKKTEPTRSNHASRGTALAR
ncbi:GntG family PLP-dependent aldolase [Phytohabitans sp. LJ34]|uniref:GntG family PLP-dependent aldolase n=1 Tax=Phytohabitans sp. LJ34 TaxID=3452217 RepID=UPI003F8AB495